jgi:reductive dehalogenase
MNSDQETIPVSQVDDNDFPNVSRREFFKRTAVGGGVAMLAGGAALAAAKASLEGKPTDELIQTNENFKPKDQRDILLTFALSRGLAAKHPERSAQYSKLHKKDFDFFRDGYTYEHRDPWDNNKVGYTQADRALMHAAWYPLVVAKSRQAAFLQPNTPLHSWDQSDVEPEQYDFGSDQRAANMIKSAARIFGAIRCGIARFDKRFVYDPIYDIVNETELTWEKDFPFEPKSVIVSLMPMDYDGISTSPAWTTEGTVGDAYTNMSKHACQLSKFIRVMGYNAVGAGNDLGNSVAFGILAGLGEGGRNSQLLAPGIGPRVRICKIFTNIDFGEAYDQPHTWGMQEFCKSCKKCAEACPVSAHSFDDDTSYEPTYEFSDEPGYTWSSHTGIKKFHSDSKKCFNFWIDQDGSCGNCMAACTFNEPDVWHHWFIMAINPGMPRFIHSLMAEAHPAFGYGGQTGTPIASKVEKFWESGEGMRVNSSSKNAATTAGKA